MGPYNKSHKKPEKKPRKPATKTVNNFDSLLEAIRQKLKKIS